MSNTIEAVRAAEAAKEQQLHAEFRQLVEGIADDAGQLGPDELSDRLAAMGRSVDELETAVTLKRRRRAWAQQIVDAAEAANEMRSVEAAIKQVEAERTRTIQRLNERIAELGAQLTTLNSRVVDGSRAQSELAETVEPALLEQIAGLRRQAGVYRDRATYAQNQLYGPRRQREKLLKQAAEHERRAKQAARAHQDRAEAEHNSMASALREQAAAIGGDETAAIEARLADTQSAEAELNADIERLEAERLRP